MNKSHFFRNMLTVTRKEWVDFYRCLLSTSK